MLFRYAPCGRTVKRHPGRCAAADAANTVHVIGGPAQMATLSNNTVQMTLPDHLLVDAKPYSTFFVANNTISSLSILPQFPSHTVLVSNIVTESAVLLEGEVLIGGRFEKCTFYYDGGNFYRDPSVVVVGGRLIFGPGVPMDSYFAEKARRSFPELDPISYKDIPNGEAIAKRIWPSDTSTSLNAAR